MARPRSRWEHVSLGPKSDLWERRSWRKVVIRLLRRNSFAQPVDATHLQHDELRLFTSLSGKRFPKLQVGLERLIQVACRISPDA
jgi:hypothetical protein